MKFKVGDRVENNCGFIGKVQEILKNGCLVNYGDYADFEFFADLRKVKKITLKQADKTAKEEQFLLKNTQIMVEYFCDRLGWMI